MAKVIALRFDSVKEVSTLKTLIEIGSQDPELRPQDAIRGREILKQLNKCADLFTERQMAEAADMDMEAAENKRFAGSKQDDTMSMKAK